MLNQLRSFIIWLHEPDHVARFQGYFGVLPITNHQSDLIPKIDKNNNNNNNHIENGKLKPSNGLYHRHHERKITYDTNVLDECIEEIKHSKNKKKISDEIDYKIISWFWYYFFQFGSALGNEIFYIIFFPIW
jgi:hypothetical protein